MTFTESVINGVARWLADNPNATQPLVFRQTGQYADSEFGIYAVLAPLVRDRHSLVINAYPVGDDTSLSDSIVGVQLDFYGTKLEVTRAVDDAFNRLHGLWGVTLGGVKVTSAVRQSGGSQGQDQAGNLRHTENYYLGVHRLSNHRQ